ncbi:hypothetical protein, partial [Thalassobellus citreus]|uniref:hypothetical protein n=1 Tax=Thalassobellus citreus TaxID=3367752 RepID=UPI0037B33438
MKKITCLSVIMLLIAQLSFSQSQDEQKAEKYLSIKKELTFTFKVNNRSELDAYTKDLSIVNFDAKTKTVTAWANENQFRVFQSKNISFKVPTSENEVDPN